MSTITPPFTLTLGPPARVEHLARHPNDRVWEILVDSPAGADQGMSMGFLTSFHDLVSGELFYFDAFDAHGHSWGMSNASTPAEALEGLTVRLAQKLHLGGKSFTPGLG